MKVIRKNIFNNISKLIKEIKIIKIVFSNVNNVNNISGNFCNQLINPSILNLFFMVSILAVYDKNI